jgi:hypothetical protein
LFEGHGTLSASADMSGYGPVKVGVLKALKS